jgi:hypothetical protein
MNLEKVVFGFFVLLAATLNFGFFIGDIGDPELHNSYELYAAVVVNLIATGAQVRRPHPDRRGPPGHQPRRGPAADRRGARLGLRELRG